MMLRVTWSLPSAAPRSPHAQGGDRPPRVPRAVVVALLGLVAVTSALSGPWQDGDPLLAGGITDRVDPPPPPPPEEELGEDLIEALEAWTPANVDLSWVWALVVALLLVAVGVLVRQVLRARHPGTPGDPVVGEAGDAVLETADEAAAAQLRDAVDDATAHLRDAPSPTDAIVAAWVSLETAAERTGVHRHPADTPTEFTLAVLDRAHADPDATRTLLGLYLRARFSDEPLDAQAVAAAQAALDRISAGLTQRPEPAPAPATDHTPAAPPGDRP